MRYGAVVSKALFVQEHEKKLNNAILGIAGEAGEILDHFKKLWYHPPKDDSGDGLAALRYEIGDLLFYLALLNELVYGDSLLEVAKDNIEKLKRRWPERYKDVDLNELTL